MSIDGSENPSATQHGGRTRQRSLARASPLLEEEWMRKATGRCSSEKSLIHSIEGQKRVKLAGLPKAEKILVTRLLF